MKLKYLMLIIFLFTSPLIAEEITKEKISEWVNQNYKNYFQKYYLSCEAAVIRLTVAAMGIDIEGEDEILARFPVHKTDPASGLVMDDIDGRGMNSDGTVNWSNYGAHAEVVDKVLKGIFKDYNFEGKIESEIVSLDNDGLKKRLKEDENCMGAIIWVAADWGPNPPPKNKFGQVYGEHVQFVSPLLDSSDRFVIYDVWPWPNQPFHLKFPLNRHLFDHKVILIHRNEEG